MEPAPRVQVVVGGGWAGAMNVQQQRRTHDVPSLTCAQCGGTSFAQQATRTDPDTGRHFKLYRCTACKNGQWTTRDAAYVLNFIGIEPGE
jgi:hypothetical protein